MSNSPFSVSRFRNIFILSWLIILADHIFLLRWFGLSWKQAIIEAVVNETHLVLASLLIITLLRFYLPQKKNYINVAVWCFLLNLAGIFLTKWALGSFLRRDEEYLTFLDDTMIIRGSFNFLLLGCISLISLIWYNLQDQKTQDERKQDAEKLARDAELYKLRQQLQPHFLFNSLNSINALIGTRPEEARKMVHHLSDFLRGTIRKEEQQWISLKEEMQYLQLYLEIEKVRFGNRLSTNIKIDESAEELKLPALLLQPLVENAIKFGLYDTIGDTVIHINAEKNDSSLMIQVVNPFDPETSSPKQGTGFGLQSVERRLYLLFARNDLLNTEVNDSIFTTTVKIPQL